MPTDLATRAEQAEPGETRALLEELFAAVLPKPRNPYLVCFNPNAPGEWVQTLILDWDKWRVTDSCFTAMLDANAFVDAALMLVEGDADIILSEAMEHVNVFGWTKGHYREQIALALIAAIARARGLRTAREVLDCPRQGCPQGERA